MSDSTSSPPGMWEPPSPEALQAMIPQYEVLGFLGRGGMGAVYRGKQIRLDREVAIKVLPETLTKLDDDELRFAERFELEARAMAKFNHPSIVSVFDFGETAEGQLYFVMEFVEGMDIHQYLRENGGAISQEYALSITAHVLDALEYAHTRGIIHRDIKPANILLNSEGQVKIADFGLAKALTDGAGADQPALTMSNVALGTPDFVAPEALEGEVIPDHRADLYAVGVMLYQMLTGKIPRGQFPAPSETSEEFDPRVDEIVQQAMQYDPDDRFPTASSMRLALEPVLSSPISRVEYVKESSGNDSSGVQNFTPLNSSTSPKNKGWKLYMSISAVIFVCVLGYFLKQNSPTPPVQELPPIFEAPDSNETQAEHPSSQNGAQKPLDPFIEMQKESGQESIHASTAPAQIPEESTESASGTQSTPEEASGELFENSLGMRFSLVPIVGGPTDGKHILFSIWETRVKDYKAFKAENPAIRQARPPFEQDEDHPAVYVNFDNAIAFCKWLTEKELASGSLQAGQRYRLPSDHEWSCAIGIGHLEDPEATPKSKDRAVEGQWPWGDSFPPANNTINAYGMENSELGPNGKPKDRIAGYSDPYPYTAPVDSLARGKFGLYHMSGNVMEWTSDHYDESKQRIAARSAAWVNVPGGFFTMSARHSPTPALSGNSIGFRVVLDLNQPAPTEVISEVSADQHSDMKSAQEPVATVSPMRQPSETPRSPLASVPGMETRLLNYLKYQETLIQDLSEKYLSALEGRFEAAIAAGDLALAEAFKGERSAVTTLQESLSAEVTDHYSAIYNLSTLGELPANSPEGLIELRGIWQEERGKLTTKLHSNLIQSLQALEVELTKSADLDNAAKVRDLREAFQAGVGEAPSSAASDPNEEASISPKSFENSVGMKFLPLEVNGGTVLLSVYETTVEQYRRFMRDNRDLNWPEPGWRLRDKQAAVLMSWKEAETFCKWLTDEERRSGTINVADVYTLPTMLELRSAAGIVASYDSTTDHTRFSTKYLWGDQWPAPAGVGNLWGNENEDDNEGRRPGIEGFNDGEPQIADVGTYPPNELGFHDLIGNAWEWSLDWFNDDEVAKALFGASWLSNEERTMRAAFRSYQEPGMRSHAHGFRVVLRRNGAAE